MDLTEIGALIPAWAGEIISFALGVLGGYTLKVVVDKRRLSPQQRDVKAEASEGSTIQTGNVVRGDMAGRDVKKK